MDTELARTFLVVIATGSFVEASQRLHVTQSTVSTRIQRLEETLGAELFVRNKAGTTLTPAGQQFQRHAALLTRTVEQARQEIGIVSGYRATLTVGGSDRAVGGFAAALVADIRLARAGCGRAGADDWTRRGSDAGLDRRSRQHLRDVHTAGSTGSYRRAAAGGAPRDGVHTSGSVARTGERLHLCRLGRRVFCPALPGIPEFSWAPRSRSTSVGSGLQRLLAYGGTGYFPVRMLREHELTGRVHRVAGAPEFRLPAYLCFPTKLDSEPLSLALDTIRRVAAEAA